jgi:predicted nucleic acid-binding protein
VGFLESLEGRVLYLDANVFIYALEGHAEHAATVAALLESLDAGRLLAVTSELTLAELLVMPFRSGRVELQTAYLETIHDRSGLRVIPVSRAVLVESARLRAIESMRLPDGIHFATAKLEGCEQFVSNDLRLRSSSGLEVLRLPRADL